jgi:hypothetical protein
MEYAALFGLYIMSTQKVGFSVDMKYLNYPFDLIEIDNIDDIKRSIINCFSLIQNNLLNKIELMEVADKRNISWALSEFIKFNKY